MCVFADWPKPGQAPQKVPSAAEQQRQQQQQQQQQKTKQQQHNYDPQSVAYKVLQNVRPVAQVCLPAAIAAAAAVVAGAAAVAAAAYLAACFICLVLLDFLLLLMFAAEGLRCPRTFFGGDSTKAEWARASS